MVLGVINTFRESMAKLPKESEFKYDLERVIDDWVLMGFMVGNDFIPHLPHMHIKQDHLPLIYAAYAKVLPEFGDYLTYRGKINPHIFQKFIKVLTENERETFEDAMADARFLRSKRGQMIEKGQKPMSKATNAKAPLDIRERQAIQEAKMMEELEGLVMEQEENGLFDGDIDQGDVIKSDILFEGEEVGTSMGVWDDVTKREFIEYRNEYYTAKFSRRLTPEFQFEMATEWFRAMQWIMYYYYTGCQSWGWFFPYHYAPFMSDLVNLHKVDMTFDLGRAFMPFEQLLAVLPAASKAALPSCFHSLMESPESPIIQFYPTDFSTDLNGKTQEWESVVLISFIDENLLRDAMKPKLELLSQEEKDRNRHSPATMYQFQRDPPSVFPSSLPGKFPDIDPCYSIPTEIWPQEWHIAPEEVRFGLIIENVSECLRPGFPSLNHVTHICKRETRGVKVFQQASRSQNFIMYIGTNIPNSPYVNYLESSSITSLCQEMLGKVVAVGWPHCYGAKVVEISSRKERAFFKVRF